MTRLPLLLLIPAMAGCDLRSDEDVLRDAVAGQLDPSTPTTPEQDKPTTDSSALEAVIPKTASGRAPVPARTPKTQRLEVVADSWASRGDAAAYSTVTFGNSGSVWMVVADADPVALTSADAFSPTVVRMTDTAVEFLDMPASDPAKVYPPEPDTDPIRLMSVPRGGGKATEIVNLRTTDQVARAGAWTYAPAGTGPSTSAKRMPLVARGPSDQTIELGNRSGTVEDLLVTPSSLVWTVHVRGVSNLERPRTQLWITALDDDGRPASVSAPAYEGSAWPTWLAHLDGTVFAITNGTMNASFNDGTLSRWDPKTSTFVPKVVGVQSTSIEALVATDDALCWSAGHGDFGLYCYRPASDTLIEVTPMQGSGWLSAPTPFAGGLLWSERLKGGHPGATFFAVP
ncbi:MAG: hypothetical protein AAGA54_17820 [Myxococcota bacterium]